MSVCTPGVFGSTSTVIDVCSNATNASVSHSGAPPQPHANTQTETARIIRQTPPPRIGAQWYSGSAIAFQPKKTARLTWHLSLREGTKLPADERPPGPRTLTADNSPRP